MELTPDAISTIRDFRKLVVNMCAQGADYRDVVAQVIGEQGDAAEDIGPPESKDSIPMVDFGDEQLTGDDIFSIVELLSVDRRVIIKGKAITLHDLRNLRALLTTNYFDVMIEPAFALGEMVYIAVNPTSATQAEERDFFDMVHQDIRANGNLECEVQLLCAGIRQDPDYRLSWIANLAQSFVMAGVEHFTAQQGAANFLDMFAQCDSRKDDTFQHPPEEQPDPPVAVATAFGHSIATDEGLNPNFVGLNLIGRQDAERRTFHINLDPKDPAPYQTVEFLLRELLGRDIGKPRIRLRDGLVVYVLEDGNEAVIAQIPAK